MLLALLAAIWSKQLKLIPALNMVTPICTSAT